MAWSDLVKNVQQYGFLGPIVGIAGLLIGAGTAIFFGWTRTLDAWKPPTDVLPDPLSRMVTMLCAIAIFVAWILAEPSNVTVYVHWVLWLTGTGVVGFLGYVALKATCGRFRRPVVNSNNQPAGEGVIWGGFWTTPRAREALLNGVKLEKFLAGNQYEKSEVWSAFSLSAAAVVTALVLLVALVCSTAAISTAATTAQVVLTKKPARQVFSADDVPGLPSKATQSPIQPSSSQPK